MIDLMYRSLESADRDEAAPAGRGLQGERTEDYKTGSENGRRRKEKNGERRRGRSFPLLLFSPL
jgi:hypothetical protein